MYFAHFSKHTLCVLLWTGVHTTILKKKRKKNRGLSSLPLFCSCLGLHNRAALDPELTHCLNALSERVLFSGWLWLCTFPVFCPVQTNISSLGRALCCKLTKMQEKFSKIFSYSLLLCIDYIYVNITNSELSSCPCHTVKGPGT